LRLAVRIFLGLLVAVALATIALLGLREMLQGTAANNNRFHELKMVVSPAAGVVGFVLAQFLIKPKWLTAYVGRDGVAIVTRVGQTETVRLLRFDDVARVEVNGTEYRTGITNDYHSDKMSADFLDSGGQSIFRLFCNFHRANTQDERVDPDDWATVENGAPFVRAAVEAFAHHHDARKL
jgi:hypothetical protein